MIIFRLSSVCLDLAVEMRCIELHADLVSLYHRYQKTGNMASWERTIYSLERSQVV